MPIKEPIITKYRPRRLKDVIGQPEAIGMVRGILRTEEFNRALLVTGPWGCGKTTIARLIAQGLNCQKRKKTGDPCGKCSSCKAIKQGNHPDVREINAAKDRGIDTIRELVAVSKYSPRYSYRVFILDEAHMITKHGFQAFLKGLEEPALSTLFILVTTEPEQLPNTIRSRSLMIPVRRVEAKLLAKKLLKPICKKEDRELSNKVLIKIAKTAKGHPRDALTALQQVFLVGDQYDNILEHIDSILKDVIPDPPQKLARLWLVACRHQKIKAVGILDRVENPRLFLSIAIDILRELFVAMKSDKTTKFSEAIGELSIGWLAGAAEELTKSHLLIIRDFAEPRHVLLTATFKLMELGDG